MLTGKWRGKGVFNLEQLDPDPFIAEIGRWGLPYKELFGASSEIATRTNAAYISDSSN